MGIVFFFLEHRITIVVIVQHCRNLRLRHVHQIICRADTCGIPSGTLRTSLLVVPCCFSNFPPCVRTYRTLHRTCLSIVVPCLAMTLAIIRSSTIALSGEFGSEHQRTPLRRSLCPLQTQRCRRSSTPMQRFVPVIRVRPHQAQNSALLKAAPALVPSRSDRKSFVSQERERVLLCPSASPACMCPICFCSSFHLPQCQGDIFVALGHVRFELGKAPVIALHCEGGRSNKGSNFWLALGCAVNALVFPSSSTFVIACWCDVAVTISNWTVIP